MSGAPVPTQRSEVIYQGRSTAATGGSSITLKSTGAGVAAMPVAADSGTAVAAAAAKKAAIEAAKWKPPAIAKASGPPLVSVTEDQASAILAIAAEEANPTPEAEGDEKEEVQTGPLTEAQRTKALAKISDRIGSLLSDFEDRNDGDGDDGGAGAADLMRLKDGITLMAGTLKKKSLMRMAFLQSAHMNMAKRNNLIKSGEGDLDQLLQGSDDDSDDEHTKAKETDPQELIEHVQKIEKVKKQKLQLVHEHAVHMLREAARGLSVSLEHANAVSKASAAAAETDLAKAKDEVKAAGEATELANSEKRKAQRELESVSERLAKQSAAVESERQRGDQMASKVSELEAALEAERRKGEQLSRQLEVAERSAQQSKASSSAKDDGEAARNAALVEEQAAVLEESAAKLLELEANLAKEVEETAKAREDVKTANETSATLKNELDEAHAELEETHKELDEAWGKLDEARGELERLESEASEAKQTQADLQARLDAAIADATAARTLAEENATMAAQAQAQAKRQRTKFVEGPAGIVESPAASSPALAPVAEAPQPLAGPADAPATGHGMAEAAEGAAGEGAAGGGAASEGAASEGAAEAPVAAETTAAAAETPVPAASTAEVPVAAAPAAETPAAAPTTADPEPDAPSPSLDSVPDANTPPAPPPTTMAGETSASSSAAFSPSAASGETAAATATATPAAADAASPTADDSADRQRAQSMPVDAPSASPPPTKDGASVASNVALRFSRARSSVRRSTLGRRTPLATEHAYSEAALGIMRRELEDAETLGHSAMAERQTLQESQKKASAAVEALQASVWKATRARVPASMEEAVEAALQAAKVDWEAERFKERQQHEEKLAAAVTAAKVEAAAQANLAIAGAPMTLGAIANPSLGGTVDEKSLRDQLERLHKLHLEQTKSMAADYEARLRAASAGGLGADVMGLVARARSFVEGSPGTSPLGALLAAVGELDPRLSDALTEALKLAQRAQLSELTSTASGAAEPSYSALDHAVRTAWEHLWDLSLAHPQTREQRLADHRSDHEAARVRVANHLTSSASHDEVLEASAVADRYMAVKHAEGTDGLSGYRRSLGEVAAVKEELGRERGKAASLRAELEAAHAKASALERSNGQRLDELQALRSVMAEAQAHFLYERQKSHALASATAAQAVANTLAQSKRLPPSARLAGVAVSHSPTAVDGPGGAPTVTLFTSDGGSWQNPYGSGRAGGGGGGEDAGVLTLRDELIETLRQARSLSVDESGAIELLVRGMDRPPAT